MAGWKLHVTKRWCRQTHRLALHRCCVHRARYRPLLEPRIGLRRIGSGMRPTTEYAPSSRCIAYTKRRLKPVAGIGRRRHRLATPPMRRAVPSSRSIARSGWLVAARYQAVVQAEHRLALHRCCVHRARCRPPSHRSSFPADGRIRPELPKSSLGLKLSRIDEAGVRVQQGAAVSRSSSIRLAVQPLIP